MSTRTVKLPLVNTDAGSRLIGYLASQQRVAYNHAVHVLNREPSIPKRATTGSTFGLNKRITAWRNQNPQSPPRSLSHPPAGQRGCSPRQRAHG